MGVEGAWERGGSGGKRSGGGGEEVGEEVVIWRMLASKNFMRRTWRGGLGGRREQWDRREPSA